MKKLILPFLFTATLLSCSDDAVENLTTITSNVSLTRTIEVSVADGQPLIYTSSETFDASSEGDFNQFGDKIDKITINNISYKVLDNANYSNDNDASIVDGTLQFKKSGGSSIEIASISNLNLDDALGDSKDLAFDQNALDAMAAEFKTQQKLTTDATIELDKPVSFDLEVTINMSVSGSVVN